MFRVQGLGSRLPEKALVSGVVRPAYSSSPRSRKGVGLGLASFKFHGQVSALLLASFHALAAKHLLPRWTGWLCCNRQVAC